MEEVQKYKKGDSIEGVKNNQDNLKKLLSEMPNHKVVKINKYAGNSKYVPVGVVQGYLDLIFLSWDWEIKEAKVVMNGFMTRGTLTCLAHDGSIKKMDGIGASEFQLRKGESLLSPDTLNSKAIERDVPKSESEAFKNAAKKLGNKFGRNLNRDEKFSYTPDESILNKLFNQ